MKVYTNVDYIYYIESGKRHRVPVGYGVDITDKFIYYINRNDGFTHYIYLEQCEKVVVVKENKERIEVK